MRRRLLFVVIAVLATVAAWVAAARLPLPARALTALLLVPLPLFMRWQARASEAAAGTVPRSGLYLGSALLLWAMAALTALAAMASRVTGAQLGLLPLTAGRMIGWTAMAYGAGLAVLVLGRLLRMPESSMVHHLMPVTRLEKLGFTGLSLTAGFAEELVFRGFLLWALIRASGSIVFAVLVSSALFGILHAYQDARGALRAAVLGAILALPLVATGSVVPSMVAHAAIDLTSGLILARWLLLH